MSTAMNTELTVAAWPGITPRLLRPGLDTESAQQYRAAGATDR